MTETRDVAATLEEIKKRSAAALEFPASGFAEDSIRACMQSALDVPILVALVEAGQSSVNAGPVRVRVMSGQESGLERLREQADETGEAVTEYAQLDKNGVFLVWDVPPESEQRWPLAKRIKSAREFGGITFRRRVIVVESWEEVTEP